MSTPGEAIRAELESRRADPAFRERIRTRIEADREILRQLEAGPDTSTVPELAAARDDFLAASVAVWREIDRLDAAPEGYHPVRMSVDLRKAERAAWERYRDLLPASGDCSGPATKP